MIYSLKDVLQRCHQRREKPLRQKKTIVTPSTYKSLYYHFTVYCAAKTPVRLYDLEEAAISFMPIGCAPSNDRVPRSFGGKRFLTRQRIEDWKIRQWHSSWGIRVYTGTPSEREGARWHDLEFTYQALCAAPDAVLACIETLVSIVANPLLTLTPSGGLRFSCRVPDYLHAHTESAKFYIYKDIPTTENLYERDVYLEVRGAAGHSPWDARYEILSGDLLSPPIIAKEVLFSTIDALRSELHAPAPDGTVTLKPALETVTIPPSSLGSYKLDLAKEAFLKRDLSYCHQENGLHYWTRPVSAGFDIEVLLWEREGTVWIQASKSDLGLPVEATPITDVWPDTGILPRIGDAGLPVSEKMLAVREGKLSPLAIKRPAPVLQKPEGSEKTYQPLEAGIHQIEGVFDRGARVVGLNAEMKARNNYALESYLVKNNPVCFIGDFSMVEEAIRHFEGKPNLPSLERHRGYRFLSDEIKDLPVDVRMETPFQRGNVCEDPDRFIAFVRKAVDPREALCPRCPVYAECQQRGYLSQPEALQHAEAQIFGTPNLFLNPDSSALVEKTIKPFNNTARLCIINELDPNRLFLECLILRNTLEVWTVNWEGHALGNFAQALLRALETGNQPDDVIVKRLRTLLVSFEPSEAEIVRQMCQINVKGRIIERGIVDKDTGTELARFTVTFEGGASAYIPLNRDAADRLTADGLPVCDLASFQIDEDIRIPMSITQAIELGILDMGTVAQIQAFPQVYPNPDWTFWHQLKRFLVHYHRDADAPIIWHNNVLRFWVPPVLHPNVQRLLVTSSQMSEKDFGSLFPDEKIETVHIKRTPWVAGNQLFQIRTGVHSLKTMLDYDNNWDVIGLSKTGERFLLDICAEIERDRRVKHGIITYSPIIDQIGDVADEENVCLLTKFRNLYDLDAAFEAADVVWIVGTPYWDTGVIWHQAQLIFGNDEEPLCYDADAEFQHYKDERVQRIYMQIVAGLITDIIGRVGLNRWENKKVVLMSSLDIPDITDRPETLLFDWEDFEIAGGLDKLAETIATRERFEAERDSLTAESDRAEVERVLGCSSRQANRVLYKLRGGYLREVTFREQILSLLADGEKKASEMVAVIEGNSVAVYHELRRLVKMGEIVKVRRGVYSLPES